MSGAHLYIPVDDDWVAETYLSHVDDTAEVRFRDTVTDTSVELSGPIEEMRRLLTTAWGDLADAAATDDVTRLIDKLDEALGRQSEAFDRIERAILPPPLKRYLLPSELGGDEWVRFNGSPRWVRVVGVSTRPGQSDMAFVHYLAPNGDGMSRAVQANTPLEYMTEAEMAERCGDAA